MVWHRFCHWWTVPTDLTWRPHISHWNLHKLASPRCQEEICTRPLARFAHLWSLQALEQRQKQTHTCSTRSGAPEHALGAPLARTAPRRANPASTPAPAAIKAIRAPTVHPSVLLPQPELKFAGVCPVSEVPAAARATTTVDQPTQPLPAPSNPRDSLYGPRWSS
jgi:hypothetical protein